MATAIFRDAAADTYFRLYATCKLVRGGALSAIYDLERRQLLRFDSAYYPLFELAAGEGIPAREIDEMDPAVRDQCLAAVRFLEENDVGTFMDRTWSRYLEPVREHWDAAQPIMTSVVDLDETMPDWPTLIGQLDALQCRTLQIRAFSDLLGPSEAEAVLRLADGTAIARVELIVKWSESWAGADWPEVFRRYRNLVSVRVHSAPSDIQTDPGSSPFLAGRVLLHQTAAIIGASQCGTIREGSLNVPSSALFAELKNRNGCLNRKVSVSAAGEICNCPSMRGRFGTDLSRLQEAVASPAFQQLWHLRKDDMAVCSGCEFRYVCTDCRAYLESDLSLAKPAKCTYDPATGRWGEPARAPAS